MSANPVSQSRPAETVAGLLAALSIFFSLIGVAYRPARLIPVALLNSAGQRMTELPSNSASSRARWA